MKITDIAFERNNQLLFENINFTLQPGDFLQLRGANGCGKSTLLRILAGFIEPQAGSVIWQDKSIFEETDLYQQQLHYLGHQNGIKPSLTVRENIELSCALLKIKCCKNTIKTVLEKIQLAQWMDKQANLLSAGQSRRLSLARLLLKKNPIWILDEPTTALDAQGQQLLLDLLEDHVGVGGIAVVATHHNLLLKREIKTLQLGEQHD